MLHVFIGEILANMTQVSDVAPGPLVFFNEYENCHRQECKKKQNSILFFFQYPKKSGRRIRKPILKKKKALVAVKL
jgi:hypothetical protein